MAENEEAQAELETTSNESQDTSEESSTEEVVNQEEQEPIEEDNKESESESNEPTEEELDNMSDDDFLEYINSGKKPSSKKEEPKEVVNETTSKTSPRRPLEAPTSDSKPKDEESTTPNYEEAYKAIFSPFKANGKQITPRNVDDVVTLMKMGANYTKKMQTMAPMMKAVESMHNANIDLDRLNFLIDVNNGNPEAIKQLLKDKNVDPISLDLESTKYVPKNNIASDEDVEFSNTLLDIEDSLPKIQEVFNVWDKQSKNKCLQDPRIMRALAEEVNMDRFPKVQERLEIERTFGRYKGISDIDAYVDLLRKMTIEQQQKQQQPVTTPKTPTRQTNIPDKSKAAPTRAHVKSQHSKLTPEDIFSMSEEEFNKLDIKDLV